MPPKISLSLWLFMGLFVGFLIGAAISIGKPTDSLVNATFTLIGGLISGIVGWLASKESIKDQSKLRHLDDLKKDCLVHIRAQLEYVLAAFDFKEQTPIDWFGFSGETRGNQIHWWDSFSFNKDSDPVLYEDLSNHFPDLLTLLNAIGRDIRQISPSIYADRIGIGKTLTADVNKLPPPDKFKLALGLALTTTSASPSESNELPARACLLLLMNIPKEKWVNMQSRLEESGGFDVVKRLADIHSKDPTVVRMLTSLDSILNNTRKALTELNRIMRKTVLTGHCDLSDV